MAVSQLTLVGYARLVTPGVGSPEVKRHPHSSHFRVGVAVLVLVGAVLVLVGVAVLVLVGAVLVLVGAVLVLVFGAVLVLVLVFGAVLVLVFVAVLVLVLVGAVVGVTVGVVVGGEEGGVVHGCVILFGEGVHLFVFCFERFNGVIGLKSEAALSSAATQSKPSS